MDSLSQIGFFQFDNLVKNRVPFLLVNLGANLEGWYKSIYALHLENFTLSTTPETAVLDVKQRDLPKDYALIVLCPDGSTSTRVAEELEKEGFLNVFFVREGLQGMQNEKI